MSTEYISVDLDQTADFEEFSETEEDGNSLSVPTILVEGYDATPIFAEVETPILTGDYWYLWTWTPPAAVTPAMFSPIIPADSGWALRGGGDIDGDGTEELLWQNLLTGEVGYWEMSGGDFASSSMFSPVLPPDSGWILAGAGDIDGDSTEELLWQNLLTGEVGYWEMSGGDFASSSMFSPVIPLDSGWALAGAGDIDGDGDDELIWQNLLTGEVGYWQVSGSGFESAALFSPLVPPGSGWVLGGVGDIDNDGDADLFWQNLSNGQTGAWLMEAGEFQSAIVFSQTVAPDSGWLMAGSANVDNLGSDEILWQNAITGETGYWSVDATLFNSLEDWAQELPAILPANAQIYRVYPQDTDSEWQADYLEMFDEWDGEVDLINWSDILEARDAVAGRPIRIETVMTESLVDEELELLAYDMHYLEGAKAPDDHGSPPDMQAAVVPGPTESWGVIGTNTDPSAPITYLSDEATVYTESAKLLIQKIDDDGDGEFDLQWDPTDQIWESTTDGVTTVAGYPITYSSEVNQSGTLIYGETVTLDMAGDYRITMYFDDPDLDLFGESTAILPFGEEEDLIAESEEGSEGGNPTGGGIAYVDPINNITYIDITVDEATSADLLLAGDLLSASGSASSQDDGIGDLNDSGLFPAPPDLSVSADGLG